MRKEHRTDIQCIITVILALAAVTMLMESSKVEEVEIEEVDLKDIQIIESDDTYLDIVKALMTETNSVIQGDKNDYAVVITGKSQFDIVYDVTISDKEVAITYRNKESDETELKQRHKILKVTQGCDVNIVEAYSNEVKYGVTYEVILQRNADGKYKAISNKHGVLCDNIFGNYKSGIHRVVLGETSNGISITKEEELKGIDIYAKVIDYDNESRTATIDIKGYKMSVHINNKVVHAGLSYSLYVEELNGKLEAQVLNKLEEGDNT